MKILPSSLPHIILSLLIYLATLKGFRDILIVFVRIPLLKSYISHSPDYNAIKIWLELGLNCIDLTLLVLAD